jgi:type IV secretory pathway VirB10-like protein
MSPTKPAVPSMEGPSGIELHPTPPDPARLSKRAGLLFLIVVVSVLGVIIYGMYARNQQRFGQVTRTDARSMTAATEAGAQILSFVPERVMGDEKGDGQQSEELKPPGDSQAEPGRGADSAMPSNQFRRFPNDAMPSPSADLSPEERRRAELYQRELAAMDAPTRTSGDGGQLSQTDVGTTPARGDGVDASALLQAFQPTPGTGAPPTPAPGVALGSGLTRGLLGGANYSPSEEYQLQNMQDQKTAFLASSRNKAMDDYLAATRVPPITTFVIRAGWDIPAVLEQGINSDLPGDTRALVRESVYDTASGQHLLIPQGSRLVGRYNSQVAYGQNGLQVTWERLIFPDGSSIDLSGMSGEDAAGRSGFRDKVDNHYKRLLGFGLLTSVFAAALQLSQNHSGNVLTYPSPGEVTAGAVGQQMANLGSEVTRRNLNVQPTIKIEAGYRFNVRVNRDLAFEAAYRPLPAASKTLQ